MYDWKTATLLGQYNHFTIRHTITMEHEPHNTNEIEKRGQDTLEEPPHVLSAEEQHTLDEEFIVREEHPPHPEIDAERQEIFRKFEIEAQNEDAKDKPDVIDDAIGAVGDATSSPVTKGVLHKLGYLNPLNLLLTSGRIKKIADSKRKTTEEKADEITTEVAETAVPVVGGIIYKTGKALWKGVFGPTPEQQAEREKKELESISVAVPR
jgi:hypothetical protein